MGLDNPFPLRTAQSQGVRALNKPITILWLIGQYYLFGRTDFSFSELEGEGGSLIKDYTGIANIVDPFWRLRSDGILVFPQEEKIRKDRSSGASITDMRRYGKASFSEAFLSYLSQKDSLIGYCESLLSDYFPESYEEEILYRTGLDYRQDYTQSASKKRKRDPRFRENVAIAYNHQCAICGFHLMLGGSSIANEAAHIKWHAYDGPDTVSNGLLLCNLHHNLFDRGIFTFSNSYRMTVSDRVSSYSEGFKRWLLDYEQKEIVLPRKEEWVPREEFLGWHRENVFIR
ncbi:MAG: HNH endonuclease [Spirochaetales bacterium]|nr:HNH endonuclease [Spirochaetales bacterium]